MRRNNNSSVSVVSNASAIPAYSQYNSMPIGALVFGAVVSSHGSHRCLLVLITLCYWTNFGYHPPSSIAVEVL